MARQGTTDAQRWAEAEDLATGRTTRSPRGRRQLVLLVVVTFVVGALVAGLVVARSSGPRTDSADLPLWRSIAGTIVALAGAVVVFRSLLQVRRTRRAAGLGPSPLPALSFRQRRRAGKQLNGRAPVAPGEVTVLRRVAQDFLRQGLQTRTFLPPFVLLGLGQLLLATSLSRVLFAVLWVGLFGLAAVLAPGQRRRYQGFLDTHPAPAETALSPDDRP